MTFAVVKQNACLLSLWRTLDVLNPTSGLRACSIYETELVCLGALYYCGVNTSRVPIQEANTSSARRSDCQMLRVLHLVKRLVCRTGTG